jgi:hypothetical protein
LAITHLRAGLFTLLPFQKIAETKDLSLGDLLVPGFKPTAASKPTGCLLETPISLAVCGRISKAATLISKFFVGAAHCA